MGNECCRTPESRTSSCASSERSSPGKGVTIVLVRKVTSDKVLPEISRYGCEVLQTSHNDEGERRLRTR